MFDKNNIDSILKYIESIRLRLDLETVEELEKINYIRALLSDIESVLEGI
jgi:hypothetical protein